MSKKKPPAPEFREVPNFKDPVWAAGYAYAKDDVMRAEKLSDELSERMDRLLVFEVDRHEFQGAVADALLWLDGFEAAFAGREDWERPKIPSRDYLRRLNYALQRLLRETPTPANLLDGRDEEIAF